MPQYKIYRSAWGASGKQSKVVIASSLDEAKKMAQKWSKEMPEAAWDWAEEGISAWAEPVEEEEQESQESEE